MTEVQKFHFEGNPLEFEEMGDDVWVTAAQLAPCLGYADKRAVNNLYKRNSDAFKPTQVREIKLISGDGKPRKTRVFSPDGVVKMAIYGKTPTCRRFQDRAVEILSEIRKGGAVITREQANRMMEAAVAAATAPLVQTLALQMDMTRHIVSCHASVLGKWSHTKSWLKQAGPWMFEGMEESAEQILKDGVKKKRFVKGDNNGG